MTDTEIAYERGYRRGRLEARGEIIDLYRARISEAVGILQKPLPLPEPVTPSEGSQ